MLVNDPKFSFIFDDHDGLVHPDDLSQLHLHPDLAQIHRALQLVCLEISAIAAQTKAFSGVQFGFGQHESFEAASLQPAPYRYTIMFSTGMYERLLALFRQLTLANAFGRYSQCTSCSKESLRTLLSIPDIGKLRARESGLPIDSLLNLDEAQAVSQDGLLKTIARPPVDSKHQFDMQTLLIPALVFTYWHEVAHVVYGHLDWLEDNQGALGLNECASLGETLPSRESSKLVKQLRRLEYWADDFAARRIALDVLRSANVEKEHYVLGPFWFNRENFNTFGQLEGFPGEKIKFNLEGFLYRIAFALTGLVLQFDGFFQLPHTDRTKPHPHAEVRLSHIVDAIDDQLSGGMGLPVRTYLSGLWTNQFGYAIQTAELTLKACGATRTPTMQDGDGNVFGGHFRVQEIQAKTKRAGQEARQIKEEVDAYRHTEVLCFLDPARGVTLPLPPAREEMLGFDVRA